MSKLYTNPAEPASFSGLQTFKANHPGFKLSKLKHELGNNEVYSLHRRVKKKFPRRKTEVAGIGDQWQIDLIDISNIKVQNKYFTFLLTCIDVFSKYAWVVPLKNKQSSTVRDAFIKIFENHKPPKYIYSDWGNEFKGDCIKYFKKIGIIPIQTSFHLKATANAENSSCRLPVGPRE